eukprot:CAMPEP_0182868748 /NCGR_PEP_ID=MMETSP0034_2-20130328/9508_1 /TAXON_ID=156128 /ORGANISM="Nephroselmis pyriformis, Strain CCMP717" /LENGTH=311 /DNA_ID=CAMNT_0025001165 /DNA_START=1 /DNA_END=933 /DNA_ORIENTATION=+
MVIHTGQSISWTPHVTVDLRPSPTGVQPPGESGFVVTCACFHSTLPQIAVGVGRSILEYDTLTGCKLGTFSVDRPLLKLAYSPTHASSILGLVSDMTIRVWDTASGRGSVLYSPKASSKPVKDILWALSPSQPRLYFSPEFSNSITMVETTAFLALAPPDKFKPEMSRKPITALECHPTENLLVVGQADGSVGMYSRSTHGLVLSGHTYVDVEEKKAGPPVPLCFAFDAARDFVFAGCSKGAMIMWRAGRGASSIQRLATCQLSSSSPVHWVAFHPRLRYVLAQVEGAGGKVSACCPSVAGPKGGSLTLMP